MRVLWFSLTPSNYKKAKGLGYNGGGWIASLETEIIKNKDVSLGIAFFSGASLQKEQIGEVAYYLMPHPRKGIKSKINFFTNYDVDIETAPYLPVFKRVVDEFKPDIIQIFGSESVLGFVRLITSVPCVLHMQGLINPYNNAFYPPSFSKFTFLFRSKNPIKFISAYKEMITWKNNAIRESYLLNKILYFIGRTEWDKAVAMEFNNHALYFYGSEILRESFYKQTARTNPQRMTIVSTMSGVLYKGLDMLLKTAHVLKYLLKSDFTWIVYGSVVNVPLFEKHTGIKAADVNLDFRGVGSETDIYEALCNATAFAHTSYIDNSPNAVCEAQLVGCPVVSTNVGGISSLIEDGIDGFLIPSNDPYMMAWKLLNLYKDKQLNQIIASKGQERAKVRHNKERVVKELIDIYDKILSNNNDTNNK